MQGLNNNQNKNMNPPLINNSINVMFPQNFQNFNNFNVQNPQNFNLPNIQQNINIANSFGINANPGNFQNFNNNIIMNNISPNFNVRGNLFQNSNNNMINKGIRTKSSDKPDKQNINANSNNLNNMNNMNNINNINNINQMKNMNNMNLINNMNNMNNMNQINNINNINIMNNMNNINNMNTKNNINLMNNMNNINNMHQKNELNILNNKNNINFMNAQNNINNKNNINWMNNMNNINNKNNIDLMNIINNQNNINNQNIINNMNNFNNQNNMNNQNIMGKMNNNNKMNNMNIINNMNNQNIMGNINNFNDINNQNKINNQNIINNVNNINKNNNMNNQNKISNQFNLNNQNNMNMLNFQKNNINNNFNLNFNQNNFNLNQNNNMNFNNFNNYIGGNNIFSSFQVNFVELNKFTRLNQNNYKKKNKVNENNKSEEDTQAFNEFMNEIETIKNKIQFIFSDENLSVITTEKELLNYFYKNEKECLEFVDNNFGGELVLKKFTTQEIKNIFTNNPKIQNLSARIISTINGIAIEHMQSAKDFHLQLNICFPGAQVPDFLIEEPLNNLKCILFYSNRNEAITKIFNNVRNKNLASDSKKLNLFLENIKHNQSLIFQGIKCKIELLYLFISINHYVFQKNYHDDKFLLILSLNEIIIRQYFSYNFNYAEMAKIFDSLSSEEKKETYFDIVDGEINNSIDIIFNIIASFYYILFYAFKISKNSNDISNIGDTFINLCLKNFVIFLDKKYSNIMRLENNLYDLLKDLYISDINDLKKINFYSKTNESYEFQEIEILLLHDARVKEFYDELRNKKETQALFSMINKLGKDRDFSTFEKFIKLIPFETNVFCNTVTIFIDGFLNETSNSLDNWKDFINYFEKESMFYFYTWPNDSISNIISCGFHISDHFKSATYRAEICGKILAYIIYSNVIFKNFQINLVGFSLGTHVMKHCLKELYRLNRKNNNILEGLNLNILKQNNISDDKKIYIKNAFFIAGATDFKHTALWTKMLKETVTDKCVNCSSEQDWVLKFLYKKIMGKTAIGMKKLEFIYQGKNIFENYDFTNNGFGHLSYDKRLVAKIISGDYKEL